MCKHCSALHFPGEKKKREAEFNDCCNFGHVQLPKLNAKVPFPALLQQLLEGNDRRSRDFQNSIRNFNSALAMASMGAKFDTLKGRGPYVVRIHGQIYHSIGPSQPEKGQPAVYGQLYFLDTEAAAAERMGQPANVSCDPALMKELGILILDVNPFAKSYRMMKEVIEEEERKARAENRLAAPVTMFFDTSGEEKHSKFDFYCL